MEYYIKDIKRTEFEGKELELNGFVNSIRKGKNNSFIILRDPSGTIQCVSHSEDKSFSDVNKITNNYNQFINVTGITVNVNGNTYTAFYCLDSIISTGQSTLCRMPLSIPTSSYLSKIQISFTPYKSSIYEVSNGTVSSTLVSGAIPINNQLTYFIEKGLPYGSTFTVNYNTSTNSTTVSSTKQNVSFNLPFGNYYFSVPSITYQGCVSKPLPAAGYHSTGVEEVIDLANKNGLKLEYGADLGADEERAITSKLDIPVFSMNYPIELKPFYHKPDPKDNKHVLCNDLLAPEGYGEVIGGGQRVDDKETLLKRLKEEGLNEKDYEWYIDIRRYGAIPHSGFGLGVDRLVMWICKLPHIMYAVPFPRTPRRLNP